MRYPLRIRYPLRTLLVLLIFGPAIVAGVWEFETDTWPLFLAMGMFAYFVFALVTGFVLAWFLETALRVFMAGP